MSNSQRDAIDYRYLLIEYYKKLRLSENELCVLLMIDQLLQQKNTLITPDLLSLKMNLDVREIEVDSENNSNKEKAEAIESVKKTFEKEFKSNLSPLENSLIDDWISHGFTPEQIINAMKECLSKGKKTFRSIDKLLMQWQMRDDIEKTGATAVSDKWDKNIEETLKIAKANWIDD